MRTKIYAVMFLFFLVLSCTSQIQSEKEVAGGEEIAGSSPSNPMTEPVPEKPIPETMPTELVAPMSFSWVKDNGSRVVDGSVPFVHGLNDGKVRLYYCNSRGILSAVSKDGLTFAKELGVRIYPGTGFESVVCDPT